MSFQTEVEFTLPKGLLDEDGTIHKKGIMRLATAADEILPFKDPRVQQNPQYMPVIVLSRVIIKLGDLPDVNPRIIEKMFASDMAYLQELYEQINMNGTVKKKVICPNCEHTFEMEPNELGEA